MTDVGRTLWQGCHILRHEGVAYDEYIGQLSLLLFLKMASETDTKLPGGDSWNSLFESQDEDLLTNYSSILKKLAGQSGLVGDIFTNAESLFRTPSALRSLARLLNQTNWSALDQDVQGNAFEYLLERTATEGKQGAGQYFTPRPLVRAIVACIKPGSETSDRLIADPAVGSAGFLVEARQWSVKKRIDTNGSHFAGSEIVPRVRRLGLMNLYLHGVATPEIRMEDALATDQWNGRLDVVITNPPFGSRSGERPPRSAFWLKTGNKQFNFLQHIVISLRSTGRAAVVLPDNCFRGDDATARLWSEIYSKCNVHTILRLPKGTFAPYTAGIMTNVVFFNAGEHTKATWIYDARTGNRVPTARRPLEDEELSEFVYCYGKSPFGRSKRISKDSEDGRWSRYMAKEVVRNNFRLDLLGSEKSTSSSTSVPVLMESAEQDLAAALTSLRKLRRALNGN